LRPPGNGVPRPPRRNYAIAIALALIVFALLLAARVFWGNFAPPRTLPSDTATPAAPQPAD
jgi:hypothetical protein